MLATNKGLLEKEQERSVMTLPFLPPNWRSEPLKEAGYQVLVPGDFWRLLYPPPGDSREEGGLANHNKELVTSYRCSGNDCDAELDKTDIKSLKGIWGGDNQR